MRSPVAKVLRGVLNPFQVEPSRQSEFMRFVPPNKRDIADIAVAIESFGEAFGSIDPFGRYEPSPDGLSLFMMVKIDKETMAGLWMYIGIDTGPESSYKDMLAGSDHILYVKALKAKRGFFGKERWVGNVCFYSTEPSYLSGQ